MRTAAAAPPAPGETAPGPIIRAAVPAGRSAAVGAVLRAGPLALDLHARVARLDGAPLRLTPRKWDLLVALARGG